MHVTVDQARHHRLAARVDHTCARQIHRPVGDFDNVTVFDHNMMMFEQRTLRQVQYVAAADYRDGHE
jgi:hypothetical protein